MVLLSYLNQHPDIVVLVVPRHPERFDDVFQMIQALNLNVQRRSLNDSIQPTTQVYLADSMGEMWLWYALSHVCFVGGSLNEPGGGHNILEPIALNVPTVLGRNYFNFQTIVDEVMAVDGVTVVQDAEQAAQVLMEILTDEHKAERLNIAAQQIMAKNTGSLVKHIAVIDQYL